MNYSTVYVGMDVHKESFSLCCYTNVTIHGFFCIINKAKAFVSGFAPKTIVLSCSFGWGFRKDFFNCVWVAFT